MPSHKIVRGAVVEAANELKVAEFPGSDARETSDSVVNQLKSVLHRNGLAVFLAYSQNTHLATLTVESSHYTQTPYCSRSSKGQSTRYELTTAHGTFLIEGVLSVIDSMTMSAPMPE